MLPPCMCLPLCFAWEVLPRRRCFVVVGLVEHMSAASLRLRAVNNNDEYLTAAEGGSGGLGAVVLGYYILANSK